MAKSNIEKDTREIVITRIINAPRERVFEAWTDPKQIVKWWGPNGFTTTTHKMDVKPKGVWSFVMHGPDGVDYNNRIIYEEIAEPERIVLVHDSGKENDPEQFQTTVTFEEHEGKTKLAMRSLFKSASIRNKVAEKYGAIEGGNQTLARLDEYLAGKNVFIISRVLDAPQDLVWKAFTEPERMKQWFGPKGFTGRVAKMDFRPGGIYHYCLTSPDGKDMWGKFVYREIKPEEKIVCVNSFSDENGNLTHHPMSPTWPLEMLSTFTFEEHNGKTKLTIKWEPINPTEEERKTFNEGMDGMRQGWTGTLDQLEEYLAKVKEV